jgi:hypothetical protein
VRDLRSARRLLVDVALAHIAHFLVHAAAVLPARLTRGILSCLAACICTLCWPWTSFRARSMAVGKDVRPWRLGAFLGGNLGSLVGLTEPLDVWGWDGAAGARESCSAGSGVVVLSSHAGPWEQGARQLASFGLRPLVIVAPWPHLPRSEDAVLSMRARAGILSAPRGPRGWRQATEHLRDGGAVVVLIDSASARRSHRRALPFVGGDIAAPDAVISWAGRNGAALWVATAEDDGYHLHVLRAAGKSEGDPGVSTYELAERSVALLREAILRRPSRWAWIRPLVGFIIGASLTISGCSPLEKLPPLPMDPAEWITEAEGLRWKGSVRGDLQGTMQASRLTGRWQDDGARGRFEEVHINIVRRSDQQELLDLRAVEADGRWPKGPLLLRQVRWRLREGLVSQLAADVLSGEVPELGWSETGRLECAGCVLEQVQWKQESLRGVSDDSQR